MIATLAAAVAALTLQQAAGTALTLPTVPTDYKDPFGPRKYYGTGLKVSVPSQVTVGENFRDPLTFTLPLSRPQGLVGTPVVTVTGVPAGVEATVGASGLGPTIRLRHTVAVPLGSHTLTVTVKVGAQTVTAPIPLIRTRARILLVDDDFSDNNRNAATKTLSTSDTAFRDALLRGDGDRSCVWDTVVVDSQSAGPTVEQMEPYDIVIWYCGTSYGGNPDGNATVGGVDESNLRAWLDGGNERTLLLFGPGYVNNIQGYVPSAGSNENKWNVTENTFLKKYLGCVGGQGLVKRFADADITVGDKSASMARSPLEAQLSPIHPGDAQTVATAVLNPDAKGERAVPVAVLNRVGSANAAYVGFTWENLFRRETLFKTLLSVRIRELR